MARWVAVGQSGIEAYLKTGPWKSGDQQPFSTLPEFLRKPVYRGLGRFGWFRDMTGLFTLSTANGKLAGDEAVAQLVSKSGTLSAKELLIPAPDADVELRAYLYEIGAEPTDMTAKGQSVQIGDNLVTAPLDMTLWRREPGDGKW